MNNIIFNALLILSIFCVTSCKPDTAQTGPTTDTIETPVSNEKQSNKPQVSNSDKGPSYMERLSEHIKMTDDETTKIRRVRIHYLKLIRKARREGQSQRVSTLTEERNARYEKILGAKRTEKLLKYNATINE